MICTNYTNDMTIIIKYTTNNKFLLNLLILIYMRISINRLLYSLLYTLIGAETSYLTPSPFPLHT